MADQIRPITHLVRFERVYTHPEHHHYGKSVRGYVRCLSASQAEDIAREMCNVRHIMGDKETALNAHNYHDLKIERVD